jgi:hypothetical protein
MAEEKVIWKTINGFPNGKQLMDFPTIKYLTKEIFGQIKENKF